MADLREGRVTLPILLLLPRLDASQRDRLQEVAASGSFEAMSEAEVLEMVRTSGVLHDVRSRAAEFAENAARRAEGFPSGSERDALILATRLLLERKI